MELGLVTEIYANVVGNTIDTGIVPDNESSYSIDFDVDGVTMQLVDQVNIEEIKKEMKEYYGI